MELKEKNALSQISTDMWACFSDAADYRKKIDEVYERLLKMKSGLKRIDCKMAEDFKTVSEMIEAIDKFYMLDKFPTWEDYEREASALDSLHEKLEKQIEKEENK